MKIGMALKSKKTRKKRVLAAVLLCVALVALAAALGGLWWAYRAYPFKWQEEIRQNAALYGHDPRFIAAIVRTESSWRPQAVSSVGATGLMQIMPDTGGWIAGKNGWEYSKDNLSEPSVNIRLGCWYVDYLDGKFGGDKALLLAAYNAGENKVSQWAAEGRLKDGAAGIPYKETREFVKKVLDAYEIYKLLYPVE